MTTGEIQIACFPRRDQASGQILHTVGHWGWIPSIRCTSRGCRMNQSLDAIMHSKFQKPLVIQNALHPSVLCLLADA